MKNVLFRKAKVMAATVAMTVLATSLTVPTQAEKKKTTVYVITQIEGSDTHGLTESYKMTYNDDGLVKETKMGIAYPTFTKYSYKNKRISREEQIEGKEKTVIKYSYNKKGQITKKTVTDPKGKTTQNIYSYKKGKLSKIQDRGTGFTYTFTYKKGLISKMVITGKTIKKETIKYTYNSNKDIKKIDSSNCVQNMTYKYKNKRRQALKASYIYKKKEETKYNYKSTYTYTYKKLRVSASMASKIKEQQKELVNQGGAFLYVF